MSRPDQDAVRSAPPSRRLVAGLAVAVASTAFLFDLAMPIGVGAGVFYTLLILLTLRVPGDRPTWLAAAGVTLLTLIGLLLDLGDEGQMRWKGYVNRGAAIVTFWAMAWLAVAYKRGRERRGLEQTVSLRAEQLASLGEMAAGIAHELGTPLGALQGRLELLDQTLAAGRGDPEQVRETVRILTALGDRMTRTLRAVRNLARDASADPFLEVPVERIVREALAVLEERLEKAGIEVRVEPFDPELRLRCRETQIGQVLLNLIANAADAVHDQRERWIRIEVASGHDRVTLTVVDSGPGIPEKIRADILLPFFTTKPAGQGTGLGLSVSRAFVEAHAGTLALDPGSPHTRFVVSLPMQR